MEHETYLCTLAVIAVLLLMFLHQQTKDRTGSVPESIAWTIGWASLSLTLLMALTNVFRKLLGRGPASIHWPSVTAVIGLIGVFTTIALHSEGKAITSGLVLVCTILYLALGLRRSQSSRLVIN